MVSTTIDCNPEGQQIEVTQGEEVLEHPRLEEVALLGLVPHLSCFIFKMSLVSKQGGSDQVWVPHELQGTE